MSWALRFRLAMLVLLTVAGIWFWWMRWQPVRVLVRLDETAPPVEELYVFAGEERGYAARLLPGEREIFRLRPESGSEITLLYQVGGAPRAWQGGWAEPGSGDWVEVRIGEGGEVRARSRPRPEER